MLNKPMILFSIAFWINAIFSIATKDDPDLLAFCAKTTMGLMIIFAVVSIIVLFKGPKKDENQHSDSLL